MTEAWIIDGTRSPRGKGKANGSLHDIHPQELLAQVLNALADRTGIDTNDVDDVIIGNGNSAGDHGACIGRMSVLAAGWPVGTPGITLNRFCGSGQQAITFAAMGIQAGHQQLVVGGGVESMSRWPVDDAPPDFTAGNASAARRLPARATGHLGRPHRHDRRVQPRRCRRLCRREPGPRRQGDGRRRLRSQRRADPRTRRLGCARRRRVPAARQHARGHGQAPGVVRGHGWTGLRGLRQELRCDVHRRLSARSITSTTCTMPATPPAWSTAPAPCCWHHPTTPGRTG